MAIRQQTAMDIALAYREVEAAEKLLADVKDAQDRFAAKDIRDVFGRRQDGLQLGVPSGDNGHRLFQVPWTMAQPIIEAHINQQRSRIELLSQQALSEITVGPTGPVA